MAEFCLNCFNEMNDREYKLSDVTIDYSCLDLCEGCGEYKYCIMTLDKPDYKQKILNKKYSNTKYI